MLIIGVAILVIGIVILILIIPSIYYDPAKEAVWHSEFGNNVREEYVELEPGRYNLWCGEGGIPGRILIVDSHGNEVFNETERIESITIYGREYTNVGTFEIDNRDNYTVRPQGGDQAIYITPERDMTPTYTFIFVNLVLFPLGAICIILGVVKKTKDKKSYKSYQNSIAHQQYPPQYTKQYPQQIYSPPLSPQMQTTRISCPNCKYIFNVSAMPRPLKVQCPNCRAKGIIN